MQISFAALVLIVFISDLTGASIKGKLYLHIKCYHNPDNLDNFGQRCHPKSDCDPQFTFCVREVTPHLDKQSDKCEDGVLKKTKKFRNVKKLGDCAKDEGSNELSDIVIPIETTGRTLSLVLTINHVISFPRKEVLIDKLAFRLLPGIQTIPDNQNITSITPKLIRVDQRITDDRIRLKLELTGLLRCLPKYYGNLCNVYCPPSTKYQCQNDGSRLCNPGWRGENCDLEDHCSKKPCKSWANCTHIGSEYQCTCDGRSGKQCEKHGDPCINNLCAHGASCISTNDRPHCKCGKGWAGPLCNSLDQCIVNNPCQNGRCKNVVSADGSVVAECECNPGFEGKFCGVFMIKKTTTKMMIMMTTKVTAETARRHDDDPKPIKHTTLMIIIGVSLMVALLLCTATLLLWRCSRKRKSKYPIVNGIHSRPFRKGERHRCEMESSCEDPGGMIMAFDSNVYVEPNPVYSVDPKIYLSDKDTLETLLPSEAPSPPPGRPTFLSINPNYRSQLSSPSFSTPGSARPTVRFVRPTVQ